jgi:hypothetical protein
MQLIVRHNLKESCRKLPKNYMKLMLFASGRIQRTVKLKLYQISLEWLRIYNAT